MLRRLTRAAVEDIGLADPQAVVQALAAWDTYDRLGSPEGELAIAQLVIYLATAPKSNAAYKAFGEAQRHGARDRLADAAEAHPQRADPADARSRLWQGLCLRPRHRGRHSRARTISRTASTRREFYRPTERGFEREIKKRLEYWDKLRQRALPGRSRPNHERHGHRRRGRRHRCASTAGSAGIIRGWRTAGSKSCCAPGRSGSTASAPNRATGCRPGRRSGCRRCPRRRSPANAVTASGAAAGRGGAARRGHPPRRLCDRPQQAAGPGRARRQRHDPPCRRAARRAAVRLRTSGRAWFTGSTRTPAGCC